MKSKKLYEQRRAEEKQALKVFLREKTHENKDAFLKARELRIEACKQMAH